MDMFTVNYPCLPKRRIDDPFECRWNYVVIEKVSEGPMSVNEVMGWWEAVTDNNFRDKFEVKKLDHCPLTETHTNNYTGIG